MTAIRDEPSALSREQEENRLVHRANHGAKLLTARGVGMRVVSVLSNFALLALVTPADLGLLAVVRGLTALAGNTTDLGFAWALLRRPEMPTRDEYASLAGIQLAMVLGLLGVALLEPAWVARVAAIAPGWRWWLLAVLVTTVTVPFGTSGKIRIERNLDYRKIAFYDMSSILLLNLSLLFFAAIGKFAIGVFLATGGTILYSNLLLWFWAPGPLPSFRPSKWKTLAGEFAGFSAGHGCYLLFTSATPIVVANLFGLSVAGLWSFAVRLGNVLQVAFEGFRRAAVPAAALLSRSEQGLRKLAEDSLVNSSRLTVPVVAAMFAALPAVPLLWPRWEAAVPVGQFYLLGFALGGLATASLVPAAVARRGASVVVVEQLVPMVVGWAGFGLLWLLGENAIGYVILPMYLAQLAALWRVTSPGIRPHWRPELTRLFLALGLVIVLTVTGQLLRWEPVVVALAAAVVFAAAADIPRLVQRVWHARRVRSA
ncbi:MAG: oligosaccharide flippase family protein [Gemmatimonadales bacterium]